MKLLNPEAAGFAPCERGFLTRFAERTLRRLFRELTYGRLTLIDGADRQVFGSADEASSAQIQVLDGQFYPSVLFGGSIGAGESYMRGEWDTPDLTAVIRVMSRNMETVKKMEGGPAALRTPLLKVLHLLNRNTRAGSRKNIAAHYDLGNDFFKTFLDPTMMYSAAVFPTAEASLEQASLHKLDRICRKLDLGPDDHLLEIGTGWGGFAVYAAKNYGCRVTTTTISKEQYAYAQAWVKRSGLAGRVELRLQDYRDLTGTYDKLVSIEMIEAVGHQFLDGYFQKISSLLKPQGTALIQAITIPDDRYERALREVDFIKRYIFPGSFIPSIGAMTKTLSRGSDLRLVHLEDHAEHYARTLAAWRENFEAHRRHPVIQAFPEAFRRMWRFYFSYCEGAFRERIIGSAQLLFAKPLHRGPHLLHPFGDSVAKPSVPVEVSPC